jgi:hypothetical protein
MSKRLINLARRRFPQTEKMSDEEIMDRWNKGTGFTKKAGVENSFVKGFMKTASPLLAEQSYGSEENAYQQERQQILEDDGFTGQKGEPKAKKIKAVEEHKARPEVISQV